MSFILDKLQQFIEQEKEKIPSTIGGQQYQSAFIDGLEQAYQVVRRADAELQQTIWQAWVNKLDLVCLAHGKKRSEHICLYCCICFKNLTPEECHEEPDGTKVDMCKDCGFREQIYGMGVK